MILNLARSKGDTEIAIMPCPITRFRIAVRQEALREDSVDVPNIMRFPLRRRARPESIEPFLIDRAERDNVTHAVFLLISRCQKPLAV